MIIDWGEAPLWANFALIKGSSYVFSEGLSCIDDTDIEIMVRPRVVTKENQQ